MHAHTTEVQQLPDVNRTSFYGGNEELKRILLKSGTSSIVQIAYQVTDLFTSCMASTEKYPRFFTIIPLNAHTSSQNSQFCFFVCKIFQSLRKKRLQGKYLSCQIAQEVQSRIYSHSTFRTILRRTRRALEYFNVSFLYHQIRWF